LALYFWFPLLRVFAQSICSVIEMILVGWTAHYSSTTYLLNSMFSQALEYAEQV